MHDSLTNDNNMVREKVSTSISSMWERLRGGMGIRVPSHIRHYDRKSVVRLTEGPQRFWWE